MHSGTWLLIFSIILSILVALFIFRKNINFYIHNKWVMRLATVWRVQNAIMIVSVAWRNYWYIQSYNLAYKRIGVLVFLCAALVGIITVIIKIQRRKSLYYLLKTNSTFIVALLLVVSFINWDMVIARYNLAHKSTAYIHHNFLISLDDSALPLLLAHDDVFNTNISVEEKYRNFLLQYPGTETYKQIAEKRANALAARVEGQSWASWNLKDYLTLKRIRLTSPKPPFK